MKNSHIVNHRNMSACLSVCFTAFIILSLIFHLGELVLNSLFIIELSRTESLAWFTIIGGLLILPLVTIQLVSALLSLQKRSDNISNSTTSCSVILHILQLGFLWRHVRILQESDIHWKKHDFADLSLLRLFYTFSASLPVLGIETYMLLTRESTWVLQCAFGTTLFSICWTLASFRRQYEANDFENAVLSCPGTLFRILWRLGEIVARVLSLAVFASVYYSWIFIVIGLHWVTMMVCICTSVLGNVDAAGMNRGHKFIMCFLVSYIYVFCHVNMSIEKSTFHYITYYIILFLENSVLTLVWFFSIRNNDDYKVHVIIFITCLAYIIAIISMVIYYRFFHIPTSKLSIHGKDKMCIQDGCINCKLSLCAKHSHLLQRPFSAGWVSQYQKALHDGHYYKNLLQDSLIDSFSEWEISSSSTESTEGKQSDKRHKVTKNKVAFHSSGTYSHRRFMDADIIQNAISESDTEGSTTESQHNISSSEDSIESELSLQFRHQSYMADSKTRLLTESWDNLVGTDNPAYQKDNTPHHFSAFRPISAQSLEDWYSDGYSTDHASEYQLPVTVLAKNSRCSISVASDSTDCTMCKYMKSYQRRKFACVPSSVISKHEKISEESEERFCNAVELEKLDTPRSSAWYNCSESGDSAFPQENISSSNLDTTLSEDEDGVYESGMEIII